MPSKRFYDEDEAEQILKLASKKMGAIGSVPREQLLQTAAELGISPEALQEAEAEYQQAKTEQRERRDFDIYRRREFMSHLGGYVFVNAILIFIDLRGDGHLSWALWPLGLWGLGLLTGLWSTFAKSGDDYEKEFGRWRKKQRARAEMEERLGDKLQELDEVLDEIADEVDLETEKIEAIRQLRSRTGLDLKDAKDVVEAYVSQRS